MREIDIKNLTRFITRTGMYIGEESKHAIVSFIHGYEMGTAEQCEFTKILDNHLEETYQIPQIATGWPGKITLLTERNKKSWILNFKTLALEIVESMVNENYRAEYDQLTNSHYKRIGKNE